MVILTGSTANTYKPLRFQSRITIVLFREWTNEGGYSMPECNNCGSFVTPTFVRVFGDNDNDIFGCPDCTQIVSLQAGEAANPES